MIVTAALCWWNERPEDLAACVIGLSQIADRIIAVDGAYARYPGATARSPEEQAAVIRGTAAACGLACGIHVPDAPWAGQVAKRSFMLAAAAEDSDWIAVVDADWIIHADREAARSELESVGADVVTVPLFTPNGQRAATGWHEKVAGTTEDQPHLFRALPGLRAETMHYWLSGLKDGERVWLWPGRRPRYPRAPMHRMTARYEITHRTNLRTEDQKRASRAFCNDRELVLRLTGQEDDRPDLPRPVFDFETVPYR